MAFVDRILLQHDLRFVVLAAIICAFSAFAGMGLLNRARRSEAKRRLIWVAVAALAVGFGIWSTHFIAMLAFMPGIPLGYQPFGTLASLLIAVIITGLGFLIASFGTKRSDYVLAGIIVGGGISGMHYIGMSALVVGGDIVWDGGVAVLSVLLGAGLAAAALLVGSVRQSMKSRIGASLLLTLAICSMHFTAMTAADLSNCFAVVDQDDLMPVLLAAGVAISSFVILGFVLLAMFLDERDRVRSEEEQARMRGLSDAVVRSERNFRLLIKGVTDYAIYMLDPDGRVANWNSGAQRAKGYTEAEIVGQHYSVFFCEAEREAGKPEEALKTALAKGKIEAEGWRYRKDGTRFWASVVIEALHDEDGGHVGFAKITRDITRQHADAERIATVSQNLELALSHMSQGLALFDAHERIVVANMRLREILDVPEDVAIEGLSLRQASAFLLGSEGQNAEAAEAAYQFHRRLVAGEANGELVQEYAGKRTIRIVHRPAKDGGFVSTVEDISERKRSEAQIVHMARHDSLTGLPNRTSFSEQIAQAIAGVGQGQKLAVLGIDLDRFKEVNDQLGHAAGDSVLMTFAERISAGLGNNAFVARFGGDEFAAYVTYSRDAELDAFIERVQSAVRQRFMVQEHDIAIGASIGVALYPQDADNGEKLISNADMAMYRAKTNLTERVCFYEQDMDEAARDRRMIARDLWNAVDLGQLRLKYQVQKSVQSGAVTGYEVLLRWQHPTRGLISPVDFIPLAEECGAILPIGEWVLRTACREAANWPNNYKVAVNLSPVQLSNADMVGMVGTVLKETGLPPERLELEVTESAIISDKLRALHTLRQIKGLGVTIAIDDFGTGYSSLETLRSFPFDKIKLDRSFMAEVETSKQSKAIVRAILALGRSLEVPVLAEGVETSAQLLMLVQEGCDEAQGYYLGRPETLPEQSVGDADVQEKERLIA